jgi:cysteine synthase B
MQTREKVGASDIIALIGNTPLLRLPGKQPGPEIWAKAEWANPGGSVKDRAALRMIEQAEQSGALKPGQVILDATSGNTGIAYAMIGAAKGYSVEVCLPANASAARQRTLRMLGAQLVLTDPMAMTDGAILEARKRLHEHPGRYFYPDQYNNDANWQAHYCTTGPEIWEQSEGRVTHFLAGLGTTGTFMGVGRYLKERNPDVQLIALQPDSPYHGLEGLKHMDTAMVPGIYRAELADRQVEISTEEAYAEARRLAREDGWMVGVSAAANVAAAKRLAGELASGVIVTVLCDGAARYLNDAFWETND